MGEKQVLVGQRQQMSLLAYTKTDLWQRFIRRHKTQPFPCRPQRYSVQMFDPGYFQAFRPELTFEK